MVKKLIIACSVIYLLELISLNWMHDPFVVKYFALIPHQFINSLHLWQVVSYLFLHDARDPIHLLLNMLILWLFGSMFESRWGSKAFLKFYLISGVGAGFAVVLSGLVDQSHWMVPTLGASGSIYALMVAYGMIFPEQPVYFFAIFPLKGKHLIMVLIIITLLYALAKSPISYSAHFGGMLMGYLLVTGNWRPRKLKKKLNIYLTKRAYKRNSKKYRPFKDDNGDDNSFLH